MDDTSDIESNFELIRSMSPGDVLKNFGVYGVRTLFLKRGYPADEVDKEIIGNDSNMYGRPSEATPLGIIDHMIIAKKREQEGLMINSPFASEREADRSLHRKIEEEIKKLTDIKNSYKQGDVKPTQDLLMGLQEKTLQSFLSRV